MKNGQQDQSIRDCPDCGQRLRVPENTGGLTLECPECGHRFASDFKLGRVGSRRSPARISMLRRIFEFPGRMLDRLLK